MAEREGQIGKVQEEQKPSTEEYKHTQLEAAFQQELQEKFQTELIAPFIDENGNLVRASMPIAVNDKLIAFQYRRFDPLTDFDTFKFTDQWRLMEFIIEFEDDAHVSIDDDFDVAAKQIRQIIKERDGSFSLVKALTDPNYYSSEGIQWPEEFAFILAMGNQQIKSLGSTMVGNREIFSAKGGNIYGKLRTYADFKSPFASRQECYGYGDLQVGVPNKSVKSYEHIFGKDWCPSYLFYEHSMPIGSPKKIAAEFGNIVSKLTEIK